MIPPLAYPPKVESKVFFKAMFIEGPAFGVPRQVVG